MGSMISSGIFILPSAAYDLSGPSIIISYMIAGACAILGSLSMIELTTAMPKAGGVYFFASRSLGALVGTLSGILMWLAIALKAAFAIYGLSAVLSLYSGINFFIVGVILTCFYVSLNIKGTQEAAKFDICLVSAIIVIMIPFAYFGFQKINPGLFVPFVKGNGGFFQEFATAAFVSIAFGGIMNAANISEEAKNPKRDIPRAIITAVIVVCILYAIILFISIGVLPGDQFAKSINPIADAGRIILGKTGFVIITIAACFAFSSCANSGILSSSRYPLALSRDNLAPKFVGYINKKTKTPVIAIVLTGILIILALTLKLKVLVEGASTVILTSYILTDLSVLILRKSHIQNYKPTFKVPFYPFTQIISLIIFSMLIYNMGFEAIKISGILIGISLVVYLMNIRKNKQKFALFHTFESIKKKKVTSFRLEEELKNIIHERDNIVKDEFDIAIENANIIDLEDGPYNFEDFLNIASEKLSRYVKIDKNEIKDLLLKREDEGSTVLLPSVAIPHIIVDKDCFYILLARCRKGIKFSEEYPEVKTVITLVGSRNKRNLHLRTLAAVAQIIQDENFEKDWDKAKTTKNLKDIFLLAKRTRNN